MSIALFVESNTELDGLPANAQTLMFTNDNKVNIYHRVSNGSKGKGQVWKPVTNTNELPTEAIVKQPVGVVLTDRDLILASAGQVTNMAIKAMYASDNAEGAVDNTSHVDSVKSLISRLEMGDQTLADYVLDKRSTTGTAQGIVIRPIMPTNTISNEAEQYVPASTISAPSTQTMSSDYSLALLPPDPKWGKMYINRRIDGVTDFDILDYALANQVNVRIEGEAGSGKTMCVQGYASARNYRYFNVSNNTSTEPSELFGQWIPTPDGKYRWQDGAVTQLVRNGGVLLLNEVNFLPARVSTILFSLLDYRREIQLMANGGEVIKAHPNLLIVADMNIGYKGTQELNQAFSDRFGIKLEFHYDKAIEGKIVKSKALLELASQLREQYENEVIVTPTSTRALVDFLNNTKKFGINFAITSFVNGYNKDERHAVRMATETHKDNISIDLGLAVEPSHPSSPDEVDYVTMSIKGSN